MSGIRIALVVLCAVSVLAAASASAATAMNGTWIATSPKGKVVLKLRGSGTTYRGTYTAEGKVSKVTLRLSNADGAGQVTLTFTARHRSSVCGLVNGRLFCAASTGTLVFAHA